MRSARPASRPEAVGVTRRGSPPAIWTAFAVQGRWKNWVLAGQLLCLLFLIAVCLQLATKDPDVVVVGADGQGEYVRRSLATAELLRFLAEQKSLPSDVTVVAFTRRFVKSTLQVSSATFADDWGDALGMMAAPLRDKLAAEARQQKLVEANQLLQVRTRLTFEDVLLVERKAHLFHVRALLQRERLRPGNEAAVRDALQVELVLSAVRRSPERPDGLEVLDWRVAQRPTEGAELANPKEEPQ